MADELVTVRIPELPENPMPTGEDRIPIWVSATNKTNYASLATLSQYFALGGGATVPPNAADKGRYVFDITQAQIDAGGGNTIYLPEFAGKNCLLTIDGRPFTDAEYDVLSAGGFTITIPGYKFQEGGGQRVVLDFAEKIKETSDGGSSTASGGFITGKMVVSVNTTMTKSDAGKLVQIRAGSNAITLTLPDLSQLPENTVIVIETAISNNKPTKIAPQGGQFIYMNKTSYTTLYMHPGESLMLYRDADGFIVFGGFEDKYKGLLGKPVDSYEIGEDEILLDGSPLNRSDYPRLWERVQTFGQSLIDDSLWLSSTDYKGCWSRGDGTTTFRVPNWMGMTAKALSSEDANRPYNHPGGYQDDGVGPLNDLTFSVQIQNGSGGSSTNPLNGGNDGNTGFSGMDNKGTKLTDSDGTWLKVTATGGWSDETTVKNIGVLKVCKY